MLIHETTLRPMRDEDMEFLFRLYASTREEELAVVAWTPEQKEAFLRHQFQAQHAHYQQHYAATSTFNVVERGGRPIGRLYVARWAREIRIVDIAILPQHQGRGTGEALLRALLDEGDAAGKPVSIHVEANNPARRLYERLGFEQRGEHGVYHLMVRPAAVPA